MTNKPTDAEIIKALECISGKVMFCKNCAYNKIDGSSYVCMERAAKDALDLINRLKAENEALISAQETLQKHIAEQKTKIEVLEEVKNQLESDVINERMNLEHIQAENERLYIALEENQKATKFWKEKASYAKQAKAEAIKEVVGRLRKSIISQLGVSTLEKKEAFCFCLDEIDEIESEMVGDTE